MNSTKAPLLTTAALIVGAAMAVIGAVWLGALLLGGGGSTTNGGSETGDLASPRVQLVFDSEMSTGSTEFSAVALNERDNRLLIADDEGWLFEFDLDVDDTPITPPRRTVKVTVGSGDVEGLAWISDSTYAIADEGDGTITIADLELADGSLGPDAVVQVIQTTIDGSGGNGLEGIAYVGETGGVEFLAVQERPPTLYELDAQGKVISATELDIGVEDLSDVSMGAGGVVSVLSDENQAVIDVRLDAEQWVVDGGRIELALDIGRFDQPEGLVWSGDGRRLYVVGESPGPERFSFAYFLRE